VTGKQEQPQPRFMTIGQVAAHLGLCSRTLKNYERAGKIPTARRNPFNGRRIYSQTDLAALEGLLNGEV